MPEKCGVANNATMESSFPPPSVVLSIFSHSLIHPQFISSDHFLRFVTKVSELWDFITQESGKTLDHCDGTKAKATIGDH